MKIAIFHNFLDNIGGAEMVSLYLARELRADIYTTNIDREKIAKMGFGDVTVKSIGRVPINAPFKQQAALLRFRLLNLGKKYDFYIISGDWAMSGAVNNRPNLWYVHSPIREIWDLYEYTRKNTVPWWARLVFDIWAHINRHLNKKYLKNAERVICNSINTKNRLKNFLGREAEVINPPVDANEYQYKQNGDYWLSVNRLISHKRVDIQLKAFFGLPEEKLIIIGSYEKSRHFLQYKNYIQSIKPDNVEIRNWVGRDELLDLYANCKGMIATAYDEDFGMAPVEAMASGKPVIASNEGGHKETVIDSLTGKLIDNLTAEKLVEAIKEVGQEPERYKMACLERAGQFDLKIFIQKIKQVINSPAR